MLPGPSWDGYPAAAGASSQRQREAQQHLGATQGAGLPADVAVQFAGAGLHAAGAAAFADAGRVEAAVVGHLEHQFVADAIHDHPHAPDRRMPHRIGHRLAADAEQVHALRAMQRRVRQVVGLLPVQFDLAGVQALFGFLAQLRQHFQQGAFDAAVAGQDRAQVLQDFADHLLLRGLVHAVQQGQQAAADVVVQVVVDAPAFLVDRMRDLEFALQRSQRIVRRRGCSRRIVAIAAAQEVEPAGHQVMPASCMRSRFLRVRACSAPNFATNSACALPSWMRASAVRPALVRISP